MKKPGSLEDLHIQSDRRASDAEQSAALDSANRKIPSSWTARVSSWFDGLVWRLMSAEFQEELEIDRRRQQRLAKNKKQD